MRPGELLQVDAMSVLPRRAPSPTVARLRPISYRFEDEDLTTIAAERELSVADDIVVDRSQPTEEGLLERVGIGARCPGAAKRLYGDRRVRGRVAPEKAIAAAEPGHAFGVRVQCDVRQRRSLGNRYGLTVQLREPPVSTR